MKLPSIASMHSPQGERTFDFCAQKHKEHRNVFCRCFLYLFSTIVSSKHFMAVQSLFYQCFSGGNTAVLLPSCRKEDREGKCYLPTHHRMPDAEQGSELRFPMFPFMSCFVLFYFSLIPCEWAMIGNVPLLCSEIQQSSGQTERATGESSLSSI